MISCQREGEYVWSAKTFDAWLAEQEPREYHGLLRFGATYHPDSFYPCDSVHGSQKIDSIDLRYYQSADFLRNVGSWRIMNDPFEGDTVIQEAVNRYFASHSYEGVAWKKEDGGYHGTMFMRCRGVSFYYFEDRYGFYVTEVLELRPERYAECP
ncbi:MAG: hypothetical protein KDD67_03105 [Ignavibacteriae bacterium]|nr:hypothetical protein [Ignavibacteriota bacterium]MCB9217028.1 hypothetical protein [Ignavibacteria bacterium]